MAIKRITAANENLTNGRSRVEAQHYWAETHGKLVANGPALRRYHHYFSLPEAYDSEPKPTTSSIRRCSSALGPMCRAANGTP